MSAISELIRSEADGTISFGDYTLDAKAKLDNFDTGISFSVEGPEDAQITLELEEETEYEITVDGASAGKMKTNLGGKLTVSVELGEKPVEVQIQKC